MKKSMILIFLALSQMQGAAQHKEWTLRECISHALEHNITVKQSALNVEQKEIDLNTAQGRRLPGVNASGSESLSFGRGLTADNTYTNSNTSSTSFSLGMDVPVFQGMQINNGVKMGRLDLQAAMADLAKAKDDVRIAVAQAYVQILYNQELLKVAVSQEEHDSMLLYQMEEKKNVGKASAADVAAQQATLAQSKVSRTQAEANLKMAVLELTQLLELPSPEGFTVAAPASADFATDILMTPEAIYEQAVGVKPAVLSAELALDRADLSIASAKGAYLPSVSLSAGLGSNYYTTSKMNYGSFADQMRNNFSQYVGLSLNVPIFTRFSTRNNLRTAKVNKVNQMLQVENVKKALYKEIQQAYYNAVNSQAKYLGSGEARNSAYEHYRLTEEKYINGKAGIAEYNDAKNNFLRAESDLLRSRYECLFQTRLLDFYRGEEIVM